MGRGGPQRSAGGTQPPIRGWLVGIDAAAPTGPGRVVGSAYAIGSGRGPVERDDCGAGTGKIARSLQRVTPCRTRLLGQRAGRVAGGAGREGQRRPALPHLGSTVTAQAGLGEAPEAALGGVIRS